MLTKMSVIPMCILAKPPSGRLQGVDYCTPECAELVDELGDDDGDEVELLSGGQSASRHTGRLVYSDHTTYAHISIK